MKELAESYIKFYEGLNKWVKFVLNFLWAIPTNLYRVAKSLKRNDTVGAVIGAILLVFCGWWVIAVIDFVTIAVYDKVYWFDFNDKKFFADTAESAAENNDVKTEDVNPEETKTQNADEGNTNADKID